MDRFAAVTGQTQIPLLQNRIIDWQLQLDNQLPVLLEGKKEYKIPKYMYHRVIKGEGKLVVEIEKHEG